MKRPCWRTALLVVVGLCILGAAQRAEERPAGVLAPLRKHMTVGLKDTGRGWRIEVVAGAPLGQRVLEVGSDYVVLQDPTAISETRIPLSAIHAVVVTRLPGKD